MTEMQKAILREVTNGNTTITGVANALDKTEQGIKKCVTNIDRLMVNKNTKTIIDLGVIKEEKKLVTKEQKIQLLKREIEELERQPENKLVNLTRHPVVIDNAKGTHTYAPSGIVCRVNVKSKVVGTIDGVNIREDHYCELINYPNKEGETYIVSGKVGRYLHEHGYSNFVMSDTKKAVIKNNKIVSVQNFWRYPSTDFEITDKGVL